MKQAEILECLKNGETIVKTASFKFKYGKLQRGTSYNYTIGEHGIKENQFSAIRDLITKDNESSTPSVFVYKLKQ